jgi:hypothetical protein
MASTEIGAGIQEDGMEQSHHDVGAMIPLTREQCHQAALAVCSRARDVDDAALLLDALGLTTALRPVSISA